MLLRVFTIFFFSLSMLVVLSSSGVDESMRFFQSDHQIHYIIVPSKNIQNQSIELRWYDQAMNAQQIVPNIVDSLLQPFEGILYSIDQNKDQHVLIASIHADTKERTKQVLNAIDLFFANPIHIYIPDSSYSSISLHQILYNEMEVPKQPLSILPPPQIIVCGHPTQSILDMLVKTDEYDPSNMLKRGFRDGYKLKANSVYYLPNLSDSTVLNKILFLGPDKENKLSSIASAFVLQTVVNTEETNLHIDIAFSNDKLLLTVQSDDIQIGHDSLLHEINVVRSQIYTSIEQTGDSSKWNTGTETSRHIVNHFDTEDAYWKAVHFIGSADMELIENEIAQLSKQQLLQYIEKYILNSPFVVLTNDSAQLNRTCNNQLNETFIPCLKNSEVFSNLDDTTILRQVVQYLHLNPDKKLHISGLAEKREYLKTKYEKKINMQTIVDISQDKINLALYRSLVTYEYFLTQGIAESRLSCSGRTKESSLKGIVLSFRP